MITIDTPQAETIVRFSYDHSTNELYIMYRSGLSKIYHNIPVEVYNDLCEEQDIDTYVAMAFERPTVTTTQLKLVRRPKLALVKTLPTQERLAKERHLHNEKVKRLYKLQPKKR